MMLPLFGIAMFLASFRTSSHIQVLMDRKDNVNLYTALVAVGVIFTLMIGLSFSEIKEFGIAIAMIAGELILLIGLGAHLGGSKFFTQRIKFLIKLVPVVAVCILLKIIMGESLITFAVCMGIYLIWTFFFYRKLLFDSSFVVKN